MRHVESYSTYIHNVLKQVQPNTDINKKGIGTTKQLETKIYLSYANTIILILKYDRFLILYQHIFMYSSPTYVYSEMLAPPW